MGQESPNSRVHEEPEIPAARPGFCPSTIGDAGREGTRVLGSSLVSLALAPG